MVDKKEKKVKSAEEGVVNTTINDESVKITKVEEIKEPEEKRKALSLVSDIDAFIFGNKLVEKLTPEQVEMCKRTAISFGLNPLKREIHFVPREVKEKINGVWQSTGKYEVNIVVGYETYIKRAELSGRLKGWKVETILEGKYTSESWENNRKVTKERDDYKSTVTIYREDWKIPFVHEVWLSESMVAKSPIWEAKPKFMLRKTAISQGFRNCFPEELAGVPYTPEELGLGTLQGGELQLPEPKPLPPQKSTVEQHREIKELCIKKDRSYEGLMNKLNLKSWNDTTFDYCQRVISKLQSLPEVAQEQVDPDEISAAMEADKHQTVAEHKEEVIPQGLVGMANGYILYMNEHKIDISDIDVSKPTEMNYGTFEALKERYQEALKARTSKS